MTTKLKLAKLKKKANEEKAEKQSKKGIRCPSCKQQGGLTAVIVMVVRAPFAKGGGVKMAGISVTHKTAKEAWDKRPKKIVCTLAQCGAKFTYKEGEGLIPLDAE